MNVEQLNQELNAMIVRGDVMEAFERFYDDRVVMQENAREPCVGKDANRQREREFLGSIETLHDAKVVSTAAGDDVSYAEMSFDATYDNGERIKMNEVAVRRWKDGKIVFERFYYDA